MSLAACQSGLAPDTAEWPSEDPERLVARYSEWPPQDFELVVEELTERNTGAFVTRRFSVRSDGLCVYAEALETIGDQDRGYELPVFTKICAYRLLRSHTRLLARQLFRRGVLDLNRVESRGDNPVFGERSIRLFYRAFGNERLVVTSGQVRGPLVRVLNVVNAYVPPGDSHLFALPGLAGDREPERLNFDTNGDGDPDVLPVNDAAGALACYELLLQEWPDDPDLLLSTFALACWQGKQVKARGLLDRWLEAAGVASTAAAPFSDPPRITREMLEAILRDS